MQASKSPSPSRSTSKSTSRDSRTDNANAKNERSERSFADQIQASDPSPKTFQETEQKSPRQAPVGRESQGDQERARQTTDSIQNQTRRKPLREVDKKERSTSDDEVGGLEMQRAQMAQVPSPAMVRPPPPPPPSGEETTQDVSGDLPVDKGGPDISRGKAIGQIGDQTDSASPIGLLPATTLQAAKASDRKQTGDVEESAAAVDIAMAEQGQVRKKAMEDFMASMRKEFGVTPSKIVDAFSKMDDKSLLAAPEESTQKFLSGLKLSPQQQTRAADLYKQMVKTTGDAALNEKLIGVESGLVLDVVSPREQSLRNLNDAIDQLDNAFALRMPPSNGTDLQRFRAQLAADNLNAQLAKLAQGGRKVEGGPEAARDGDKDLLAAAGLATGAEAVDANEMSAIAGGAAMQNAALTGFEAPSAEAAPSEGIAATKASGPRSGTSALRGTSLAGTSEARTMGRRVQSESKAQTPDASGGFNNGSNATAESAMIEGQNAPAAKSAAAAGPAGMILERPVPTAKEEQDNVRELIHQAQAAIKKGGGEIKMDLKPEGMGQVHLKVSVEDGQVNVQMLTESDAAKHLLEKGLHELKSNLAAHQLKLEGLKVDVSPLAQKHMGTDQQADDQARQQTRQFANDVMGQLREERQAFQQGFMENPGWRQYSRPMPRSKMDPASQAAAVASSIAPRRSRENSSGLDLVA